MRLWTPRPSFTVTLQPFKDVMLAKCQCGHCGGGFSIVLRGTRHMIETMPEAQVRRRVFDIAFAKHDCSPDSYKENKAETNRIVNKWHEYKLKLKKFGAKA